MPQSHLDNTVRALFYQILLMSSKNSIPADVTNIIATFYVSHNLSKAARLEIDTILQSAGIYKIGKEGTAIYIFKVLKHYKLSNDDSSRLFNAARDLITRILFREELQQQLDLLKIGIHSRDVELKNEIRFLEDDIACRIESHNLFIENCFARSV